MIIAETDRLILRAWQESDKEPFAAMNADPMVMRYLGASLSRQQSDEAIANQSKLIDKGEPAFWAVERRQDNHFMGCIGVKRVTFEAHFTPCYEIGWRLDADYWGQGYATEGAKAALAAAFANWNMPSIYSFTVYDNIKSQSVMERIGMKRIMDGDFEHPNLAKDDPLSKHVLYNVDRASVIEL